MEKDLKVRTGIVLAAGMNARMRPDGDDSFLKPLASVARNMLLVRTLKAWKLPVVTSALW